MFDISHGPVMMSARQMKLISDNVKHKTTVQAVKGLRNHKIMIEKVGMLPGSPRALDAEAR